MKKLSEVPEAIPHAALWHGNDLGYSLSTNPANGIDQQAARKAAHTVGE
jgi:hypothetical protein